MNVYLSQPREVSIETLARCNAACTFCPYPTLERIGQKMPDELISRLIDEMATWRSRFAFSPFKVNEPLLDKRLYDICQRVAERTLGYIRIFTNGSPLTQAHIDKIANLDKVIHLWVSLNETDPDKYRKLMSLDFERTARNLDNLHSQDFPHQVVLSTVGVPNDEFIAYCEDRWPKFDSHVIANAGWLGYSEPDYSEVPDTACARWFELSIMANGVVALCCMDSTGEYAIGDVNKNTMLEIYNAPEWKRRRRFLTSRREVSPCNRCTY